MIDFENIMHYWMKVNKKHIHFQNHINMDYDEQIFNDGILYNVNGQHIEGFFYIMIQVYLSTIKI